MTYQRISIVFLVVSLPVLLFCACQEHSNVGSTPSPVPTWPPDTMAVTLLGSGHLGIVASWKAPLHGGTTGSSIVYEVSNVLARPDTTHVALRIHTPPDTTASMLMGIFDQPQQASTTLYLVKWPPDTTGAK